MQNIFFEYTKTLFKPLHKCILRFVKGALTNDFPLIFDSQHLTSINLFNIFKFFVSCHFFFVIKTIEKDVFHFSEARRWCTEVYILLFVCLTGYASRIRFILVSSLFHCDFFYSRGWYFPKV